MFKVTPEHHVKVKSHVKVKVTPRPGDFGVTLNTFARLILEILNVITQTNHIAHDHWSLLYQLHRKVFYMTQIGQTLSKDRKLNKWISLMCLLKVGGPLLTSAV